MSKNAWMKVMYVVVPLVALGIGIAIGAAAFGGTKAGAPSAAPTAEQPSAVPEQSEPAANPDDQQAGQASQTFTVPPPASGADAAPKARTVGRVTVGESSVTQGNPDAKVTVTTVSDPRCPHCAVMHQLLGETFHSYIQGDDVKVESVILDVLNQPYSQKGANLLAMVADLDPEHYGAVEEAVFSSQGNGDSFTDEQYIELAKNAGAKLPGDAVKKFAALSYFPWVQGVTQSVTSQGINSVPRIFVNGTPVQYTESNETVTNVQAAVDQALAAG